MNKKNMIFAFLMSIFASSRVLPIQELTPQQEQQRIEHIVRLSDAQALKVSQYVLNGSVVEELIDRDIILFEKNSRELLNKKAWAQGYLYSYMIPGILKTVALPAAIGACAAGIAAGVSSVWAYKIWNSSVAVNAIGAVGSAIGEPIADLMGMTYADQMRAYFHCLRIKADYLAAHSEENKNVLVAAPASIAATIVLAGIAQYSFTKASNYNQRNSAYIQDMQQQYDRNQVVIAQLQHIKYENHS